MTKYDDWNNAIYNYYFEDKNLSSDFLFFVDENILQEIGKNFDTEDVIKDFCRCIRNRITYNDRIDLYQSNGVSHLPPKNTAIIAFFIYIASCLGEKSVDNFIDSYWEICANKLNISVKNNQSVFEYNAKNKNIYFDMFNKFAEFINKNHCLNFKFNSLYKRSEGQSDYIGLPISQSMFSTKDRYLLSQVFDKYYDKKIEYIYNYVVNNINGYSKILKKLCFDPKYSEKIKETLKYLRENWDYVVVEVDDYSKTGSRIVSSPLLIGFYKTQYGDFKLGVTTYNKGYENIIFRYKNIKYELSRQNNTKFYPLNTVFFEHGNPIFYDYSFATNHKIQLKTKPCEKRFILLTKAEEGSYIQIPNNYVMQNTYFSILGTREFFENDYESFFEDYVTELKQPLPTLTENIYVVTDLFAESYDNEYIKLSIRDKVNLKKGLKIDRNTYVEGAGPIISVNGLSKVEILDNIRKTIYKNSNAYRLIIDESKDYGIGSYKITCNYTDIGESFVINDISMIEPNKSDKHVFQTISSTGITKIYSEEEPERYVLGAYVCGFNIDEKDNLETDVSVVEQYNKIAEEFFECEQYELAIENWKEVLKLDPKYEIDYFNLAYAQAEVGDDNSALKNFQKYIEKYPNNSMAHYNIGLIYENRGEYDKALQYYQQAYELDPKNKLYINNLADAYYLLADSIDYEDSQTAKQYYAKVVEYYNEVLKLDLGYEIDYFKFAYAQNKTGDKSSALKNYQKYLEKYPDDSIAHNNIGNIYKNKGEYDKAVKYYQKAHELDPEDELYINNLAGAYNSQADIFYENEQYQQAVEYYQEVLRLDPEYDINYFRLAYAQDETGDTDSALKNYQLHLDKYPNSIDTNNNMGIIYYNKGEYKKAVKCHGKAVALDSSNEIIQNNFRVTISDMATPILQKAYNLAAINDYDSMKELADHALQQGIETAEIYHIAGYALFRQYENEKDETKKSKAINYYKRAYEMVQSGQYYYDVVRNKIEQNYRNIREN